MWSRLVSGDRLARAGAWAAPFVLVLYLAFNNGGFDVVERSEVGLAVWWIVLVGTLVGALPAGGTSWAGRAMLLSLGLFAAWTALSLGWTESAERTAIELGKVVTYLGIFAIALAIQGAGRWRSMLAGVTAAVGVIAVCAVLSRLEPGLFPEQVAGQFFPNMELERRLSYPLNYSTGLAALMAMGVPLLLHAAVSARSLASQALAAAALPIAGLALWLTASSLALPLLAVGVLAFLLLSTDRLPTIATLLVAGIGTAVLIGAETQRAAVDRGLPTPAAEQQGDELLALCLLACGGVALLQLALSLFLRYSNRPRWLRFGPRAAVGAWAAAALVTAAVAVGLGAPGKLAESWEEFTDAPGTSNATQTEGRPARQTELLNLSSSGRYEFWRTAQDAFESEPLLGIGPGTFEFWWSRNGSINAFVRDAHSLVFETLGELGVVGLLLLAGFGISVLVIGATRAFRVPLRLRSDVAAATAASFVFLAAVAIDWSWELGAISAVFMLVAAVAVAGGGDADPAVSGHQRPYLLKRWGPTAGRVAVVGTAIAALVAIALPMASAALIQESRAAASRGDLDLALAKAQDAAAAQPYAATPRLQQALVLEREGRLADALDAARSAVSKERTNWRVWLIVSRLEARSGNAGAAVEAFREARSLNPRSSLLAFEKEPS